MNDFRTPMELANAFNGAVHANLAHTTLELTRPLPAFPRRKNSDKKTTADIYSTGNHHRNYLGCSLHLEWLFFFPK